MYEMKGALAGYAARLRRMPGRAVPDPLVSQRHRSSPAAIRPRRSSLAVPQPHRFQFGRVPAPPFPVRLVPASPVRAVRLPVRPGATRRPPVPDTRGKYRFPGLSRAPGEAPGMVPVSCGESISTPSAPVAQEPAGIHFDFFSRPHVFHRTATVIRTRRWLSTGVCTTHPQATRCNSMSTDIAVAKCNQPVFAGNIR